MRRQTIVVGVLVALGWSLAVPAVAGGALLDATDQPSDAVDDQAALGHQVSAFMQSSASDANASADTGLFRAEVRTADDPADRVADRLARLEQRVDRLEATASAVEDADDRSSVAHVARASAVHADIANLWRAIAAANETARERGVAVEDVAELRTRAGDLSGPELAESTRRVTHPGGPPGAGPGNGHEAPGRPGSGDEGEPAATGPPGDAAASGDRQPGLTD